jgi:hypothetical protein
VQRRVVSRPWWVSPLFALYRKNTSCAPLTLRARRLPLHRPLVLLVGVLDQAGQHRRQPAVRRQLRPGDGHGYVWWVSLVRIVYCVLC